MSYSILLHDRITFISRGRAIKSLKLLIVFIQYILPFEELITVQRIITVLKAPLPHKVQFLPITISKRTFYFPKFIIFLTSVMSLELSLINIMPRGKSLLFSCICIGMFILPAWSCLIILPETS